MSTTHIPIFLLGHWTKHAWTQGEQAEFHTAQDQTGGHVCEEDKYYCVTGYLMTGREN